jgi:hypothetical protein
MNSNGNHVKFNEVILKSYAKILSYDGFTYISIKGLSVLFKSERLKGFMDVLNLINNYPKVDIDYTEAINGKGIFCIN